MVVDPGGFVPTAMGCKLGALAGCAEASWAVVALVNRQTRDVESSDATLILEDQ